MKCRVSRVYSKKESAPEPAKVTLTLSGYMTSSYSYVKVDGTAYSSTQTLELDVGTEVTVTCTAYLSSNRSKCTIKLNGSQVAKGTSSSPAMHTFTLTGNADVVFTRSSSGSSSTSYYYYSAAITM